MQEVRNWIDGKAVLGEGEELSLDSPLDESVIGSIRLASLRQLDRAVESAALVQNSWAKRTFRNRAQIFYRYHSLLQQSKGELAALCHQENGTSITEAEVDRALELVEFATSAPNWLTGRIQLVSRGVECRDEFVPVGVCSSITPFNFPVMYGASLDDASGVR